MSRHLRRFRNVVSAVLSLLVLASLLVVKVAGLAILIVATVMVTSTVFMLVMTLTLFCWRRLC